MKKYLGRLNAQLQGELLGLAKTKKKKTLARLGLLAVAFFLITGGAVLIFFIVSNFFSSSALKKTASLGAGSVLQTKPDPKTKLIEKVFFKELPENFNLLFLGIPGGGNDAPWLTDSIILFRYKDEKLRAFSFPRDLLVKIPGSENLTKLNALYAIKKEPFLIIEKIEEISGVNLDFYVVVDLEGVKKTIDILGGINLLVKEDIYDPKFPGPGNSFELFQLKAGWRYLDGETALKYIRTRFSPAGDFDRIDRQQQLLLAIKKKAFSLNPIANLPSLVKVYQNFKKHLDSNLANTQILSWAKMLEQAQAGDMSRFVIDRESGLLQDSKAILGGQEADVLVPTAGVEKYKEIRKFVEEKINR